MYLSDELLRPKFNYFIKLAKDNGIEINQERLLNEVGKFKVSFFDENYKEKALNFVKQYKEEK